jgi:hypothetical protein
MPNSSRLATRQTPALHLIITDILIVTILPTSLPSDEYPAIDGKKSSRFGPHAPRGQARPGTTKEACFSVTPSLLSTHPDDRRARATSSQFIRHGTVVVSFPTTAVVQLKDDCISVSA